MIEKYHKHYCLIRNVGKEFLVVKNRCKQKQVQTEAGAKKVQSGTKQVPTGILIIKNQFRIETILQTPENPKKLEQV